jgi:site-specific recombinase XerD
MKAKKQFTLSQMIQGYLLAASARHLSNNTILDYQNSFNKFVPFIGQDVEFNSIKREDVERFLASFTNDLTNKTLLHYYTALAAVWTWAMREELTSVHIIHSVTPPKPEQREVIPFTETEFKLMLASIARSKPYQVPGKRKASNILQNADRNRAVLLMLLDTGLRASELCNLKLFQVDDRNHRVQVLGKGALERSVPFSPRTAQALWRHLTSRPDAEADEPVFITANRHSLDRGQLAKMLESVGNRAGVSNVHPHRFRHTFAIQYLRNGGDAYTLQKLLGHSTLDMVRKYLALAQLDLDKAHKRASPVDNWAL